MPDAPRLRVCIAAKSTPFIWVHHYVTAFRALCDVITVGPRLSEEELAVTGRARLAHLVTPNDVDREVTTAHDLIDALPGGWRPDLVVSIQSGAPPIENIEWLSCPTAHISVDTWHDFAELLYARPYDFVFAAQREFAGHFAAAGCARAHWLPLACDPDVHRPVDCEKNCDIAFVGSAERAVHALRIERLARLAEHFSVRSDTALDGAAMARAYARGRLAFNSSVARDLNMRVFETMAMGMPLLTNRDADVNGLLDLFRDGEHLLAYDDTDLVERTQRYLADDAARARIATRARAEVLAHHTYRHRAQTVLDTIGPAVDWAALRAQPLLRGHGDLLDYLPTVPGRTADLGMNAGVSKFALRARGVSHLAGVANTTLDAERRGRSFDSVYMRNGGAPDAGPFDTVLAVSADTVSSAHEMLNESRVLLRPGGTVVAGLSPRAVRELGAADDLGALWGAVQSLGFVVVQIEIREAAGMDGVSVFVVARRQERSLKDIAREVFSRDPIPGLSLEETIARVP